jgi:hypothetical protein
VIELENIRELRFGSKEDMRVLLEHYAAMTIPRVPGDTFLAQLGANNTFFLNLDGQGIAYFTSIVPHGACNMELLFWDQKLSADRTPVAQYCVKLAMEMFDLHRVGTSTPCRYDNNRSDRSPMLRFLLTSGFTHEGVIRRVFPWKGELRDLNILSVLREEATWQLQMTSSEQ